MRNELIRWAMRGAGLALGAAAVLGMILLANAAAHVLLLIFISILLASALEPMVLSLRGRLPIGRGTTILAVYLVFFVVVIGFALLVVPAALAQAQRIAASLPPVFEDLRTRTADLRPVALSDSLTALIDAVAVNFEPAPPPRPDEVVEVGAAVAEAAIALATVLTLVFFWLVENARLQRYALAYLPANRRAGARIAWNEIENRLGLWVRGQLVLMGAIGLAAGIAYTLLGVPGALILGLIAAIAEAIPIIGPLLGAIPAILVAATISPELALVVAGVYAVLQLIEGSVLVPVVMRNAIGISPFLVLVSLLVGGAAGGLIGALIAVPVAAAIEIVLSRLQARETPVVQDASAIEPSEEAEATGGDSAAVVARAVGGDPRG
ncbi:MAG TPA: AI-2E family transporter [Candidatus Limnocylindrales bacterium]|nr:AI-2E family transporter [Candidatus Limnocylindrales bacterium]